MRSVTAVLAPHRGAFDPGEFIIAQYGARLLAIHDIDVLDDGTAVMRHEVEGGEDTIRDSMDAAEARVIDYQVIQAGDRHMLQVHYEPSELLVGLLGVLNSTAITLDYPLEFVDPPSSRLRLTAIGPADQIRRAVDAARDVVDVTIETVGPYDPSAHRLFTALTERQREVLLTAVDEGYYAEPRGVTYEDVADRLGCSAAAVGQHLRRAEAELVRSVVPDDGSRGAADDVGR